MKKIKNLFYIGMIAICTAGFTSCSSDEEYDFPGDAYNRVYMTNNSTSFKIVQTPVGAVTNMDFELALKCTQKASENISVTVEVDNSLVDAYNSEHGTAYESLPDNALVLQNATMNIPAGAMVTADTLKMTFTTDESVLATLKSKNGYLIPLCIGSVKGGSAAASTNYYTSYLTVSVTEDEMNHEATEYTGTGTLVADQSSWSASTTGYVYSWYGSIESMFDGDASNYCYIRHSSSEDYVEVDMGKSYSFDAIKMTYEGYDYSTWEYTEVGSFRSGMIVSTSENGTDWTSRGELDRQTKVCVFYAPITARYIRIINPGYFECGIFNVYAK
ncbi:MAG: DUF1735 domain-containing protein [Bacteroides sp.]|nr:DUF1735 domain-containing protein [Bacteroides sp.]